MIRVNHYRLLLLCVSGGVFLSACTRPQQFWGSPTVREIDEVRSRTVPSDGSLLRVTDPVRNDSSVRASWEIQGSSGNQAYFQWLKNQLSPEYHLTSESTSAVTFVKEIEGDSYTVEIRSSRTQSGMIVRAQFVAAPD
jgi:hypothetical protein